MKEIPLTQGKVAIVDDEDYEWLNKWKWFTNEVYGNCYVARGTKPKIYMHRLILNTPYMNNSDHINGDGLDNRRVNLRLVNATQNSQNRRPQKGCTSIFKGVYWDKQLKKWRVRIFNKGKSIELGVFKSEPRAAEVYNKASIKYFGEFAKLNEV